jgi:hypothetical protein
MRDRGVADIQHQAKSPHQTAGENSNKIATNHMPRIRVWRSRHSKRNKCAGTKRRNQHGLIDCVQDEKQDQDNNAGE